MAEDRKSMIGSLLLIVIGVAAAGLGLKGFSKEGIPFGYNTQVAGFWGKLLGLFCWAVSAIFLYFGAWGLLR